MSLSRAQVTSIPISTWGTGTPALVVSFGIFLLRSRCCIVCVVCPLLGHIDGRIMHEAGRAVKGSRALLARLAAAAVQPLQAHLRRLHACHSRSLFSVAARRNRGCPTASRPVRVTAP